MSHDQAHLSGWSSSISLPEDALCNGRAIPWAIGRLDMIGNSLHRAGASRAFRNRAVSRRELQRHCDRGTTRTGTRPAAGKGRIIAMNDPKDVIRRLREQAFQVNASDLELSSTPRLPQVWGAIMELGYPTGIVTLLSFAEGTTSL